MRDKLEAAIEANPDDDAANYIVYGDWLQSQGDPFGELIALYAANKTDEAAALMGTLNRQRFAHLEDLNLDDNALTDASKPLVAGLAKHVEFGSQDPDRIDYDDIEDRYTAVGE